MTKSIVDTPLRSPLSQGVDDFRCLDDRIQHYEALATAALSRAREIKTLRNSKVLIHRLPEELLSAIFCFASAEARYRIPMPEVISHVCRRWRLVALDNAQLWTTVSFSDKRRAAQFLRRSKRRLVHIFIDKLPPSITVRDVTMVLKPHVHRIRTFSAYVQPIKFMHTLLFRLKTGAPRLEEITLRMDPMDLLARLSSTAPTVNPVTARPLFSGETPNLRSVALSCVSLPWTTPTYQNLLHLKLIDQYDLLPQVDRLLDVFERCPALQTFMIHYQLDGQIRRLDPNVTRIDRLVSLPDLRELELSFIQPSYISAILSHLSLPGETKITLRAVIEDPHRHIYGMLPKDYTAIHTLCNFRTFEIFTVAERKVVMRAYAQSRALSHEPSFLLELHNTCPQFTVVDVSAALNLSNVESFMVSDPTARLSLPLPQWREVLRGMARVRTLRFIDMETDCLSSALEALRTPYESLAGVKRNLICPELKNLEFVGGTYSDAFSSNLVLCLTTLMSTRGELMDSIEILGMNGYSEAAVEDFSRLAREAYVND